MGDLNRKGDLPVQIIGPTTQVGMKVDSNGSAQHRIFDAAGAALIGQKLMASSLPVTMASDQTAIPTTTGVPTSLNYTFGYAVGINQPTSGTDNPLVLLKNPSGSGKTIYLSFIAYGVSVTNTMGVCRIYKDPTITANGTAQTILQFGSTATAMQLYTTPTISANGSMIATWVFGQNSLSLIDHIDLEVSVAANSNVLVTGNPTSNNRQAEVTLRWVEL